MGGSQSVEVPGGGTEGYHVLRVRAACPGETQLVFYEKDGAAASCRGLIQLTFQLFKQLIIDVYI